MLFSNPSRRQWKATCNSCGNVYYYTEEQANTYKKFRHEKALVENFFLRKSPWVDPKTCTQCGSKNTTHVFDCVLKK